MAKQEENKTGFWWKVYLVYAFFLLFAIGIVAATVKVAFIKRADLIELSKQQSLRYEQTPAVRGNVYSADGSLLAVSVPIFTVRWDMHPSVVCNDTFYKNLNPLCDSMSRMFGDRTSDGYRKFFLEGRKAQKRNFLVKRKLTYAQLQRMQRFPIFKKGQNKGGFIVETSEKREHPNGYLAYRTIGYYNANSKKGVGLEMAYNTELTGVNGRRLTQKVANGVRRPVFSDDEVKPRNGYDLITTIDIRIQDVAQSALQKCMEENEAEHGCLAVMEVSTGKIVAIANLTKQADGSFAETMNYAVAEAVEPGSTFKLASTIAILEERSDIDTSFVVPMGDTVFYKKRMRDSHKKKPKASLAEAFAESSNVGISVLADHVFRSKQQKFVDYLYKMRLNQPLGVEIPGEGMPKIKSPKDKKEWWGTSLPWMSIGYEVQLTPLQILTFYNAVANNGKMMKPLFVNQIRRDDVVVRTVEPEVLVPQICSKKTLDNVQGLLVGVVERGTGQVLKSPLYKVAAKTGTAQINYKASKKGQEKMIYRASIVGYFPAEAPRYSCIVMITNPQKNKQYGASVAGPVFNNIATKIYATLMQSGFEVNPAPVKKAVNATSGRGEDIREVYKMLGYAEPDIDGGSYYTSYDGRLGEKTRLRKDAVPDLRGLGLRDASRLIDEQGLQMKITGKGKGRVVSQTPAPGTPCAKGQTVEIKLG